MTITWHEPTAWPKPTAWYEANVRKIGKGVWACQVMQHLSWAKVGRVVTSVTIEGNRKAARQVARNMLELHNLKEGVDT